jgi:RNA polymerase sigma factor (sigma-70 family)
MGDSERSDGDLVRASQKGDEEACGELVRRYLPLALAVAWEFSESRDDAEDVVQEAFRRAISALERFSPDRPFRPWFLTILRNTARTAASERASRQHVPLAESLSGGDETPFEAAKRAELRHRIDRAVQALPEMQRQCFRLVAMEGFTSLEVAEALGIAQVTVRTHVLRARKALRRFLDPFEEEVRSDGQDEQ